MTSNGKQPLGSMTLDGWRSLNDDILGCNTTSDEIWPYIWKNTSDQQKHYKHAIKQTGF